MQKYFIFKTFQEAFLQINQHIIQNPEFQTSSRIGDVNEISGFCYEVSDLQSFVFPTESIGKLTYDYADTFYRWMMNGCTDSVELVEKYPNITRFMEKPKSDQLPQNFNTFYGPRILSQLPYIEQELKTNPDTRRAVIMILDKGDLELLDKHEALEFPCTDSATFFIRDGKLNVHVHMRSQNMAQILKLDMYLWGRFTCELAQKLGMNFGKFTSSIVSAHVFKKDFNYIQSLYSPNL